MTEPEARTVDDLRSMAIGHTFVAGPLADVLERLRFVQADPIRAPARAEDLVLRHRVPGYREGDLARGYAAADIEEGYLYAYGFMPRRSWDFTRPRQRGELGDEEQAVLAAVREAGALHPRALDERFGRERGKNPWGGQSRQTKLALERLHYRGLLRIVDRERGVRRYGAAEPVATGVAPGDQLCEMLRMTAQVLAPVREKTLASLGARYRARLGARTGHRQAIEDLCRTGELVRATVEGTSYVWPAGVAGWMGAVAEEVRLLAPFDPLVWDRARFQQLWGWEYRFEAYTPAAKRVRGYYALPMLFGDRVVGWANVQRRNSFEVEIGFVDGHPGAGFDAALEAEVERLRQFLGA